MSVALDPEKEPAAPEYESSDTLPLFVARVKHRSEICRVHSACSTECHCLLPHLFLDLSLLFLLLGEQGSLEHDLSTGLFGSLHGLS